MPGIINFIYNWNNKLDNTAFTTIRLRNDNKYKVGYEYYIDLKQGNHNVNKGLCKCIDIKYFTISQINNYIAYLDTGLNIKECKEYIQRFYKNYSPPINWDTQQLSLILLVKTKLTK